MPTTWYCLCDECDEEEIGSVTDIMEFTERHRGHDRDPAYILNNNSFSEYESLR